MATRTRIAQLARATTLLRPSPSPKSHALPIRLRQSSTFQTGPSPPRLPASEQAEFERLQRTANTQAGFNATSTPDFSSSSSPPSPSNPTTNPAVVAQSTTTTTEGKEVVVENDGVALSTTPLRKGAPPEFEGETNPRTGEVGGPKNEPLRWGAGGDYSYNGRVTDF
ncbi:DUF1674-domain-containing protein [Xylaria scruposa]|nr:DUF1674-domain-containing protein [Xylaria scruposa]